MQSFIQPLFKPPRIIFKLLGAGDAAEVEAQFTNE
jgi:hypothetical protein